MARKEGIKCKQLELMVKRRTREDKTREAKELD